LHTKKIWLAIIERAATYKQIPNKHRNLFKLERFAKGKGVERLVVEKPVVVVVVVVIIIN
jgi:hypothetical protein